MNPAWWLLLRRAAAATARVLLIALLVWLGYKAAVVGWNGWRAYSTVRSLAALRYDGDLDRADLTRAQELLGQLDGRVGAIVQEMAVFTPLLERSTPLPYIGETLGAAPEVLQAGRAGVAMAHEGAQLVATAAPDAQQGGDLPVPAVTMAAISANPEAFRSLNIHVHTAQQALNSITVARLPGPFQDPAAGGKAVMTLLEVAVDIVPRLPTVLGFDAPQTYLLLVQNNQELRATGGFISAVGTITLDQGKPRDLQLVDSYDVARNDVDHPWAPDPMQRYMGIELVFLRDANWSPDFPTTARLAKSLYAQDAGVTVDGVVSIDLNAVKLLVDALGPLSVPGADDPITGANLVEQLQSFWDQPIGTDATIASEGSQWWEKRKDFMPIIAESAINQIESGRFDPLILAAAVHDALEQRAVQIWLADEKTAQRLAETGWDGAMRADPDADFIALVDTNMGYNKVDAVLKRMLDYQVTWPDGPTGRGLAQVSVTYQHPLTVPDHVCDPESKYGLTYTDMIERCYFDYVRLYAPVGSDLQTLEGVTQGSIVSRRGEGGTQVFAGYFVLEPGYQHTVTFTYRLPSHITPESYRLRLQRQSGSAPLPVTLQVGEAEWSTTVEQGWLEWTPATIAAR